MLSISVGDYGEEKGEFSCPYESYAALKVPDLRATSNGKIDLLPFAGMIESLNIRTMIVRSIRFQTTSRDRATFLTPLQILGEDQRGRFCVNRRSGAVKTKSLNARNEVKAQKMILCNQSVCPQSDFDSC